MAGPERTADSFAVPLCLWQRAAFLSPPPGSVASDGGGGERDSLRLRIAQLKHEHWNSISRGVHPLHVDRLTHSLMDNYCSAMDSTDGVESIAAPVKVLTAARKKENGRWKSEVSVETLLAIPGVRAADRDTSVENLPLECLPVSLDSVASLDPVSSSCQRVSQQNSNSTSQTPTQPPPPSVRPPTPQPCSHKPSQHPTQQSRAGRNITGGQFPYYSAPSTSGVIGNGRGKVGVQGGKREVFDDDEEEEEEDPRWRGRRRRRGNGGWGTRKRPRRGGRDEEEEDTEETSCASTPFITARNQHFLNQQKKYGGRAPPVTDSGAQPQATSYGCSKKSLGTRRAPGSRFVPPVRREEGEGGSSVDVVRGRVQCPSGDGSGRRLPPELEGDERLRNIEPRMVELITNEIMDHGAPVQWDDIAGLQFAKGAIKEIVVWPMLRPDIFTGLRGPPKGILLFGPPGTGKTLIGKCIASQVNATFFSISASSLTSKWIGEGEKMVRALFAVARCHQPAVIFMDEIDSLLSQRSESEHESSRRIKTEFLVQLDGATTSADDRILTIGATNRPQEIDEAARRRLVKRLYIPLPDGSARKQIVTNLLREQAYSLTQEELEELSTASEGYSGADVANLCREAAYGPVREAADTIQHISAEEMRPVMYKDFQAALQVVRPSVSERDLDLYVQWNRQFGCGRH